jgi:hypothetical protein
VFPYLPEQRRRFPRDWVASVQSVFGDFLSDTELADIRRRAYEDSETGLAAELAMDAAQAAEEAALAEQKRREKEEYEQRWRALEPERKAREEALDARRRQVTNARQREKYWVRKLMRGGKFEPTTELAEACRTIADTLQDEGKQHVRWAELKKRWPSVASRYQRDFVWYYWSDPLSVAQLRNIDPDQRFVLAFGVWAGPQRIFPAKQLLIHVRAPDLFQEFQDRGGLHGVVADTAAEVGRHFPIADSIGWLRVHVDDGNRLCFVDEVQSDLLEALLQRKGNDVVKQFVDAAAQWHLGGFASIYRWARSIGYRAAIHSRESAAAKPGMTQSDRKWSTYYAPIIKRFGLREEEVKGYPARIWAGEAPGLDVVAPAGQSSPQTGTNAVGADEMR